MTQMVYIKPQDVRIHIEGLIKLRRHVEAAKKHKPSEILIGQEAPCVKRLPVAHERVKVQKSEAKRRGELVR